MLPNEFRRTLATFVRPEREDLLSKLRSGINNGFSFGLSGKEKMTLADLANLQARMDPDNATEALSSAADDITFGQGGDKSSLAALMRLGNDVEFRASGGPIIPGNKYIVGEEEPEVLISDRPGYVVPLKDLAPSANTHALTLANLTGNNSGSLGSVAQMPTLKDFGVNSGPALPALNVPRPPGFTNPAPSLRDLMVKQDIPNREQIGATIDNGSSILPAYNVHDNQRAYLGSPLSSVQADDLHKSWGIKPLDQLTAADKQYMANMPISIGATEGTYANLADITKRAVADHVDKVNAGLAPRGDSPQELAEFLRFRGGLSKTDASENNAALRAETAREKMDADYRRALDLQNARNMGTLAAITARDAGGGRGTSPEEKTQNRVQRQIEAYKRRMDAIWSKEGDSQAYRSYRRALQNIINQADRNGIEWDNSSLGLDLVPSRSAGAPSNTPVSIDMQNPKVQAAIKAGYTPEEISAYLARGKR